MLFVAALPQNIYLALATSEAQTLGPVGRVGKSKLLAICALPVILRAPTHYRSIVRVTNYNRLVDVSEKKNVHNPRNT